MKLITQKESNRIFEESSIEVNEDKIMNSALFNYGVNILLLDGKINKKLLQRVKKIKDNTNLLDKELKDYFDNNL